MTLVVLLLNAPPKGYEPQPPYMTTRKEQTILTEAAAEIEEFATHPIEGDRKLSLNDKQKDPLPKRLTKSKAGKEGISETLYGNNLLDLSVAESDPAAEDEDEKRKTRQQQREVAAEDEDEKRKTRQQQREVAAEDEDEKRKTRQQQREVAAEDEDEKRKTRQQQREVTVEDEDEKRKTTQQHCEVAPEDEDEKRKTRGAQT
ncbi:uncharacterized protein LOC126410239 [Nymphaea colorata]|uniref:uncharacterized protein LOC126410239 n=1 Tax=Nymphaea colorata TaxID=210225 RepID=UPI00214F3421|nr:uncharacterized protein LOC126410239 [Nymphaea colorata]